MPKVGIKMPEVGTTSKTAVRQTSMADALFSGMQQRALGLVTVHAVGNQKHYQANPKSPIFVELCGIAQKTVGLGEPLREVLTPLARKMSSPFENLVGTGKPLKAEPPDAKEFTGLRHSGSVRLTDAVNESLSIEGRFDFVYNAANSLRLAGLRWHGYRSANRYIVFQLLPHTLGQGPEMRSLGL